MLPPTHRYYSTPHKMNTVQPIHDGKYLESVTRQAPSKEFPEVVSNPISPAVQVLSKLEVE